MLLYYLHDTMTLHPFFPFAPSPHPPSFPFAHGLTPLPLVPCILSFLGHHVPDVPISLQSRALIDGIVTRWIIANEPLGDDARR
jgi:hypothetical protein